MMEHSSSWKTTFSIGTTFLALLLAGCGNNQQEIAEAEAAREAAVRARVQAQEANAEAEAAESWHSAIKLLQQADSSFSSSRYIEAAADFNAAADFFANARQLAAGRIRVRQARDEYQAELAGYDAIILLNFGGEAWSAVSAIATAARIAGDNFDVAVSGYERAAKMLPEVYEIARRKQIGSLLSDARTLDNKEGARLALEKLDEILALDPDHAEARELHDKISGYTSLVVPDQYRNIRQAIQAAAPGDTIKIRAGVYNERLRFKSGIRLVGEGADKVTIRSAPNHYVLYVEGCASGHISGINFEHSEGERTAYTAVGVSNSTVEIINCTFTQTQRYGLYVGPNSTATIRDCTFEGIHGGVQVDAPGARAVIHNCTFRRLHSHGIIIRKGAQGIVMESIFEQNGSGVWAFDKKTHIEMYDNHFTRCWHGVSVQRGASGLAEGNTFEKSHRHGISAYGEGSVLEVTRNIVRDNGMHGIFAGSGASVTITDNVCERNGDCGILIAEDSTTATIRQNTTNKNAKHGIQVHKGAKANIEDNVSRENAEVGISVYTEGSAATIRRNIASENGQDGISFLEGASGIAENNEAHNNVRNGISVFGEGSSAILKGNKITGSGLHGIYFGRYGSGVAEDNQVEGNEFSGIAVFHQDSAPELINNRSIANKRYGINFGRHSAGTAEGNICERNGRSGFGIYGSKPLLRNNQARENQMHGIYYASAAAGIAEDNVLEENGEFGIVIAGEGTSPEIRQNVFQQNKAGEIDRRDSAEPSEPQKD